MLTCATTPSFAVMVNGGIILLFQVIQGRQEDSLSHLLFIIVMEALHNLLEKAKEVGFVDMLGSLISLVFFFLSWCSFSFGSNLRGPQIS